MSVFTNPAGGGPEQAQQYSTAILDLLGARDPLEVLRATSDTVRSVTAGLTAAQLARPERAGKWSIRHVLRHLADSEIVWAWRLRLVLAQHRPTLTGYDQDAWAERLGYDEADAAESIAVFDLLRRGNLGLLQRLAPDDLQRAGVHVERGEESVERMMRLYAGHDLLHIRQIERIRATIAGRVPGE